MSKVTLIDHDIVKRHNLDRLLYASEEDIGEQKVTLAERNIRRHATAENFEVITLPLSIRERTAYRAAIDCDILFSCVDRPVGRDVLNFIAYSNLIPVFDGGIAIETLNGKFHGAHWRSHIIGAGHQCMRCNGQYNTGMVSSELDGSLDTPSYIATLPVQDRVGNQNVFPFSLSVAGLQINMMLRYLLSEDWWPQLQQQDYQFIPGKVRILNDACNANCAFPPRVAKGDSEYPPYLVADTSGSDISTSTGPIALLKRILESVRGSR